MNPEMQCIVIFVVLVVTFLVLNSFLCRKTLSSFVMALLISTVALLITSMGQNTNSIYGSYLISNIYTTFVIFIAIAYISIKVFQDNRY
jgi:hypothetical protein